MTHIGFIGAGNIGSTLARLAIAAGHEVILSNSRGPETLRDLVTDLGPLATAGFSTDTAAVADLVVVTIPLHRIEELPAGELSGKVVIDTNNYYPERDGRIAALEDSRLTTSGLLQERLPSSEVVKAFNSIVFTHLAQLARSEGDPDRSTLPIAGDSVSAKHAVTAFMCSIGFDALDAGSLREGWRFERGRPAYCLPYAANPDAMKSSTPGHRPQEARPAGHGVIERLLAEA